MVEIPPNGVIIPIPQGITSAIQEIVSAVFVIIIGFFMTKNALFERRKVLHRFRSKKNVLRRGLGTFHEHFGIVIETKSSFHSRLVALLLIFFYFFGFFIGPFLQTQLKTVIVLNENEANAYETKYMESYVRRKNERMFQHSFRDISETYSYVKKHGILAEKSIFVPRQINITENESIYPTEENQAIRIDHKSDITELCIVTLNEKRIERIICKSSDLVKKIESKGFIINKSNFQKINSTLVVENGKVKDGNNADAFIATFFSSASGKYADEHLKYAIIMVDTRNNSKLRNGDFETNVRFAEIEYDDPIPWPDVLQAVMRVSLNSNSILEKDIVKFASFTLALHWGSIVGSGIERRKLRTPRESTSVSRLAVVSFIFTVIMLFIFSLKILIDLFVTKEMPGVLDDAHAALLSCWGQLNNLKGDLKGKTIKLDVSLDERCNYLIDWRTSEK